MEISCGQWVETMSLWLDDELPLEQVDAIERHISDCPQCRITYNRLRQMDRILSAAPMVAPVPGFTQRFQSRLASRRPSRKAWIGFIILLFAAVGVVVLGAGFMLTTGFALWNELTAGGLIGTLLTSASALATGIATLLDIGLLILKGLARGVTHPIFLVFAVGTLTLTTAWGWVLKTRLVPVSGA